MLESSKEAGEGDEAMRDKERIDPFLEKLGKLWKENPDQRFGQLVYNILSIRHAESYDKWVRKYFKQHYDFPSVEMRNAYFVGLLYNLEAEAWKDAVEYFKERFE
jgi:hypothetical protein